MKRILSVLFHSFLFLLCLLAIDQSFVHLPLTLPGLRQSQTFYLDLRGRLLGLGDPVLERAKRPPKGPETSVERLIDADERAALAPEAKPKSPVAGESPRYLYPDADGQLQFADRLEEIPEALRSKAQRLAE
jgi:hypothetical protein